MCCKELIGWWNQYPPWPLKTLFPLNLLLLKKEFLSTRVVSFTFLFNYPTVNNYKLLRTGTLTWVMQCHHGTHTEKIQGKKNKPEFPIVSTLEEP
jgi:hypothetical protein